MMMCHVRSPASPPAAGMKLFGVPLFPDNANSLPPPLEAAASPLVCTKGREPPFVRNRVSGAALEAPHRNDEGYLPGLSLSLSLSPSADVSTSQSMDSLGLMAPCLSLLPELKQTSSATLPEALDLNSPAINDQASLEQSSPALPRGSLKLEQVNGSEGQLSSQSSYSASHAHSGGAAVKTSGTSSGPDCSKPSSNRYEVQKIRDWQAFEHYLGALRPPVYVKSFRGDHVVQFLLSLDQFGKTKIHEKACAFFGTPSQRTPCNCPMKQAWGSLDSLIGRLRAAYEECGGKMKDNPFGEKVVRQYLREVREVQAIARGMDLDKKRKRKGVEDTEKLSKRR